MSRQADIAGTVTDPSGTPLEDAEVYLFREDLAGSGGIVISTTTGSNGGYRFTSHPDQTSSEESWHLGYKYDISEDAFFSSNWGVESALGAQSNFTVTIDSTNDPVAPGNTLDVTTTVTNTGGILDTQTVVLSIDGVGQVDSRSVFNFDESSTTVTLSWEVPAGQSEQDYQAGVASEDDTASTTVTVSSP